MPNKLDINGLILSGRNVYLKKLTLEHASEKYVSWLNDKEVTEFLEVRHSVHDLKTVKEFITESDSDISRYMFGVFLKSTDEHIGNGSVLMINPIHQTFDIGYLIGNKNFWGTGAGFETCILLLSFGFDFLGLRKCFSGVYSNHIMSRFILRKIGFVHEATLKEHLIFNGKPVDEIYYEMGKELWLELNPMSKII